MCAAIPPPNVFSAPFSLWYHGSLIVWIPFPSLIPWSSTCSSTREEERDEIVLTMAWLSYVNFLTKWHLSVILNIKQGHGNLNRFIDEEKLSLNRKGTVIYWKMKRKGLLLGHDSINALAKAKQFPESASVFQWRNVYVLR